MRSFAVGLGNILIAISIIGALALGVEFVRGRLAERQMSPAVAQTRGFPSAVDSAPSVDAIPGEADANVAPAQADANLSAPDESAADVATTDHPARTGKEASSPPTSGSAAGPTRGAAPPAPRPEAKPPAPKIVPITRLQIPSIGLDSEVVPAKYVKSGGGTWIIPPFKVGHAELTAGAGQIGNGILFGHVTSISVGNIFEHLDDVGLGDDVDVYSPEQKFLYRVIEVRAVPRDDVSVLDPTNTATISMITCTGNWLPLERDYDERLIVRAELVKSVPPSA